MTIQETTHGGAMVLQVQGKLDALNAPALDQRLAAAVDGGARALVVDLSALEYISSAGLRVFLSGAKRLQQSHGKMALAGPTAQVEQIFEIAGFAAILPIYKTVAAAAAACAS